MTKSIFVTIALLVALIVGEVWAQESGYIVSFKLYTDTTQSRAWIKSVVTNRTCHPCHTRYEYWMKRDSTGAFLFDGRLARLFNGRTDTMWIDDVAIYPTTPRWYSLSP